MIDYFVVAQRLLVRGIASMTGKEGSSDRQRSIHWFRKGLRLHDNPALLSAVKSSTHVWPIFVLDPWFVKNYKVGANRWRFLAQSLQDLDEQFKKLGGRLYVIRGKPETVLPELIEKWRVTQLTYEVDTEPYALSRDARIDEMCGEKNVKVTKRVSHTLYDSEKAIKKNGGKAPGSYQGCQTLLAKMGRPPKPEEELTKDLLKECALGDADGIENYDVPTLKELGVNEEDLKECLFPGGEQEALKRMRASLKKTNWILTFEKPKTSPNSLSPSTTVLSPYLKFGCLSVRTFYWALQDIYDTSKKHTQPPVSLHGQLLFREYFYTAGYATENFSKMKGNALCRQIPWDDNPEHLKAWREGRTGYPFIDAIMIQLKEEGWVHHLARHSVACFLTRGDLYVSWEKGQEVFEEYLLDADYFLNAANWMWLSASAFFHQYFRVYSPVAFGKKTDKNGDFIKKYIPKLKKYPAQYIYEPWNAPLSVQKAAGCIIGEDYPKRIVDHDKIRQINIDRMKKAYDAGKSDKEEKAAKNGKTEADSENSKKRKKSSDTPAKKRKTKSTS